MHVLCSVVSSEMARGSLWGDEEVKALIAIWGKEGIQSQLDGTTRNIKVYGKISDCLCELSFKRTAVQCREKLKKLKSEYRRAKDHNNRSGRGRTICTYFNQLDAILGCRPASAPNSVVGSMCQNSDTGTSPSEAGSSESASKNVNSDEQETEGSLNASAVDTGMFTNYCFIMHVIGQVIATMYIVCCAFVQVTTRFHKYLLLKWISVMLPAVLQCWI